MSVMLAPTPESVNAMEVPSMEAIEMNEDGTVRKLQELAATVDVKTRSKVSPSNGQYFKIHSYMGKHRVVARKERF